MASHFLTRITRKIAARPSSTDGSPSCTPPPLPENSHHHGHAAAAGEEADDETQGKDIDAAVRRSPPKHRGTPQVPLSKSSPEQDPDDDENIVIGEYTQPVDALLPADLNSVPPSTPSDEDYSEPYESRKLLEELHAQALLQSKDVSEAPAVGVFSDPYASQDVPASVYHLAKDVAPGSAKAGVDRLSRFSAQRRNWAQGSASRGAARLTSASSEDKENTESDYDRLGFGFDRVDGASGEPYSNLYDVEGSAFRPVRPKSKPQGEVTYHDPWDRSSSLKDLEERLTTPKSRLGSVRSMLSSHDSADSAGKGFAEAPSSIPSNYCQPWDLKSVQQQLQDTMQSSRSPPSQQSPVKQSPSAGGTRPRKGSSGRIIEGGVYEAPWDSEEKQKELEEKLKAAETQKSPKKDGEGSPKSSSRIRAVEDMTVYEEPWDVSSKGRAISSMLSGTGDQKEGATAPKSPSSKEGSANTSPKQKAGMKVDMTKIRNAIGEVIDPSIKLEKQSWYHGTIGRSEAESFLRVCKEGSYLVRNSESTKTDYSLSMKSSRGFIHIKISRDKEHHKFILGENSQPFETIPEMIFHYSRNLLPIKGADHMILLHPVLNELL